MSNQMLLLRGPSQFGKSNFQRNLMLPGSGPLPAIGDGSGESCTSKPSVLDTRIGPILDGPGDDDSRLEITNEDIGRLYAQTVFEHRGQNLKVLVFEALQSPALRLRASLASLTSAFGPKILQAVVIVASRSDEASPDIKKKKLEKIRAVMAQNNIGQMVVWQRFENLGREEQEEQVRRLQAALAQVNAVIPSQLQTLLERQRRRAQELCNRAQPRTASTTVMQDKLIEEKVPVKKPRVVKYTATEYYDVPKAPSGGGLFGGGSIGSVLGAGAGAFLGGPLGGLAGLAMGSAAGGGVGHGIEAANVGTSRESRQVTKEKIVYDEVDETKYKKEQQAQTVTASYTLRPDDFMQQALAEILSEDRQRFAVLQR